MVPVLEVKDCCPHQQGSNHAGAAYQIPGQYINGRIALGERDSQDRKSDILKKRLKGSRNE